MLLDFLMKEKHGPETAKDLRNILGFSGIASFVFFLCFSPTTTFTL